VSWSGAGDHVRLQARHRVRRFVGALRPVGPSPEDLDWAGTLLSDREAELLAAMAPADQAHVLRVARSVDTATIDPGSGLLDERDWMLPAALLHDVGKSVAPLPVVGRAVVTVVLWIGGDRWATGRTERAGWVGASARYASYPELGATLLRSAGSDERVVAWAREHHLPPGRWTVPDAAGEVLAGADDRD